MERPNCFAALSDGSKMVISLGKMRVTWGSVVTITAWIVLLELREIKSKEVCITREHRPFPFNFNDLARVVTM